MPQLSVTRRTLISANKMHVLFNRIRNTFLLARRAIVRVERYRFHNLRHTFTPHFARFVDNLPRLPPHRMNISPTAAPLSGVVGTLGGTSSADRPSGIFPEILRRGPLPDGRAGAWSSTLSRWSRWRRRATRPPHRGSALWRSWGAGATPTSALLNPAPPLPLRPRTTLRLPSPLPMLLSSTQLNVYLVQ